MIGIKTNYSLTTFTAGGQLAGGGQVVLYFGVCPNRTVRDDAIAAKVVAARKVDIWLRRTNSLVVHKHVYLALSAVD